jgi:hypothetical protein
MPGSRGLAGPASGDAGDDERGGVVAGAHDGVVHGRDPPLEVDDDLHVLAGTRASCPENRPSLCSRSPPAAVARAVGRPADPPARRPRFPGNGGSGRRVVPVESRTVAVDPRSTSTKMIYWSRSLRPTGTLSLQPGPSTEVTYRNIGMRRSASEGVSERWAIARLMPGAPTGGR